MTKSWVTLPTKSPNPATETITTTNAMQNTFGNHSINKILTGSESIYIAILLSNYFNIQSITLGVILSNSDDPEEYSKSLNQASHKIINTIFLLF